MISPSQRIKELAVEAGFDLCGITDTQIVPEAVEHYKKWIQSGYHADMHYLENIERRTNPKQVLTSARSVIMLAINYYSYKLPEDESYKIARYARGRDYHKVIEKKLKHFTLLLEGEFPKEEFRSYVDYGPFSERTYAQKAGIGFIGKNGNIITKEFGSWVLLSEVLTSMTLEYDIPATSLCGSCVKCMSACPTQAFVEEKILDSNKCIAYQTIENKTESIAPNVEEKNTQWAFGCDICQEVCPFNNKLRNKETVHADLTPRYVSFSNQQQLASPEIFLETFQGTPIMRAKFQGIKRNIESCDKNR